MVRDENAVNAMQLNEFLKEHRKVEEFGGEAREAGKGFHCAS